MHMSIIFFQFFPHQNLEIVVPFFLHMSLTFLPFCDMIVFSFVDATWLKVTQNMAHCEHDNTYSGSAKREKYFHYLNDFAFS